MKILKQALIAALVILAPLALAKSFSPIAQADCQSDYLSLMAKPQINVTIAYGYFDAEDGSTWDNRMLQQFLNTMTAPCKSWSTKSCGFQLTGTGPYILTRKMTGPDGFIKTVKLTVDSPSLSSDNNANMSSSLQKKKSEAVKQMYSKGLRDSEVTLYLGHSRDGGGPDFDPPKLRHGHVDYEWYQEHPRDKKEMLNILSEDPEKARILGFFSCSSIRWFSKGINLDAPASGFIGTDETYWTSAFDQVYPFIEKIFSYQCLEKLIVDDIKKVSRVKVTKKWNVPKKDRNISKLFLNERTLENLAKQLVSKDIEIRKQAYQEIQSFPREDYGQKVWKALNDYKFGNVMGKSF